MDVTELSEPPDIDPIQLASAYSQVYFSEEPETVAAPPDTCGSPDRTRSSRQEQLTSQELNTLTKSTIQFDNVQCKRRRVTSRDDKRESTPKSRSRGYGGSVFVLLDPSTKSGMGKRFGRPRKDKEAVESLEMEPEVCSNDPGTVQQRASERNQNQSIISRFRFGSPGAESTKIARLSSKKPTIVEQCDTAAQVFDGSPRISFRLDTRMDSKEVKLSANHLGFLQRSAGVKSAPNGKPRSDSYIIEESSEQIGTKKTGSQYNQFVSFDTKSWGSKNKITSGCSNVDELTKSASMESFCLGYPVKPAPYASDIVFILSFVQRFKALFASTYLGPQELELGLGLTTEDADLDPYNRQKDVIRSSVPESKEMDAASREVDSVFSQILTLALDVGPSQQLEGKSFEEKMQILNQRGVFDFWQPRTGQTHDETQQQVLQARNFNVLPPLYKLQLLKCLVKCSCAHSNTVSELDKQMSNATKVQMAKIKITEDSYKEAKVVHQENSQYTEFPDFSAGICGLVGRFYLVRTCVPVDLASVEDYTKDRSKPENAINSSSFKLYAQNYDTLWYEVCHNVEGLCDFISHMKKVMDLHLQNNDYYNAVVRTHNHLSSLVHPLQVFEEMRAANTS